MSRRPQHQHHRRSQADMVRHIQHLRAATILCIIVAIVFAIASHL